jgi:hypothetical protein
MLLMNKISSVSYLCQPTLSRNTNILDVYLFVSKDIPQQRAGYHLVDPKSDPSVSNVVQQMSLLDSSITMEESYTQAILRKIQC